MGQQANSRSLQMRLRLELLEPNDLTPAKLSQDKRRELAEALAELLVSAASGKQQQGGGGNESQAND